MGERNSRLKWQLLASHVPVDGVGGGMVRYVVELAAALDRRDDVDLSVLAARPAVPFFTALLSRDTTVHALPDLPTTGRAALERYTRWAERGGPFDVVHGTKHLVPRRSSALRVLTVHDMVLIDRPQDFGPVKRALLGRPYLASLRDADLRLCVSAATRERLQQAGPFAAATSPVVPLAMSSRLLAAVATPVPELQGRRFAIVVGDWSPRKNLRLVVDVWDGVRELVPDAVLAVVGPPAWAAADTGDAFVRLEAAGRLIALGHVGDDALRWCYENAAVALCPSRLEGFGLPAIEACAFATPLITSTDPALCEVSGDQASHFSADRPDLWVSGIAAAMGTSRPQRPLKPQRTWDDVADETIAAVRAHR